MRSEIDTGHHDSRVDQKRDYIVDSCYPPRHRRSVGQLNDSNFEYSNGIPRTSGSSCGIRWPLNLVHRVVFHEVIPTLARPRGIEMDLVGGGGADAPGVDYLTGCVETFKNGKRATGRIDQTQSHAATSNSRLMS